MTPDKPNPASVAARTGSREDAVSLLSSSAADIQTNSPHRPNTQIKFLEAEFDADIALALTAASGWRATASLLIHAAQLIEGGDFQSAENNRRQAREQFIAANDVFRLVKESRADAARWIGAEAFLIAAPDATAVGARPSQRSRRSTSARTRTARRGRGWRKRRRAGKILPVIAAPLCADEDNRNCRRRERRTR
jgi:hypothetical protein